MKYGRCRDCDCDLIGSQKVRGTYDKVCGHYCFHEVFCPKCGTVYDNIHTEDCPCEYCRVYRMEYSKCKPCNCYLVVSTRIMGVTDKVSGYYKCQEVFCQQCKKVYYRRHTADCPCCHGATAKHENLISTVINDP